MTSKVINASTKEVAQTKTPLNPPTLNPSFIDRERLNNLKKGLAALAASPKKKVTDKTSFTVKQKDLQECIARTTSGSLKTRYVLVRAGKFYLFHKRKANDQELCLTIEHKVSNMHVI